MGANYIQNNKEGSMDMNIGNQRVEQMQLMKVGN